MDFITKRNAELKREATKAERKRVFEGMNSPEDIYATLLDGTYMVRRVWNNPKEYFGWSKWERA